MRPSLPRSPGLPSRIQLLVDLAGGFKRADRLSGISYRTLGDWARGVRSVPVAQLGKFADALGVDLHWLQSGEGDSPRRLGVAVSLSGAPPASASEIAPPVDLAGEIPVVSIGVPTITSLGADWAMDQGLGRPVALLADDESAAPRIVPGSPILASAVVDAVNALAVHPRAVWVVEIDSCLVLRTADVRGEVAELSTIGSTITRTRISLADLRLRGRVVFVGVKL